MLIRYYKMNLNSNEYMMIGEDMIIIHWTVNKPIGTINEKIKKLIFSNYNNINICTKHNNTYNSTNKNNWKGSLFNQPITLTGSLTYLIFGNNFNQSVNLTTSLTHVTFGGLFNQPISLTNSLTHLTFGYEFNQPIELGNIKYLNIDCNNLHLIEK